MYPLPWETFRYRPLSPTTLARMHEFENEEEFLNVVRVRADLNPEFLKKLYDVQLQRDQILNALTGADECSGRAEGNFVRWAHPQREASWEKIQTQMRGEDPIDVDELTEMV